MEKKRILVCSHWLRIGGAERALLGLLSCLAKSEHQVDLFLYSHKGELFPYIPERIRLLPEDTAASCVAVPIREAVARRAVHTVLGRVRAKLAVKQYERRHGQQEQSNVPIEYSHRYTHSYVKRIKGEPGYDLVLSFQEPHYIAAFQTEGKKKVAWMHTDYQAISVDREAGLAVWSQFDRIAAISESCAQAFGTVYPELKDRIIVIENMHDVQTIKRQAAEDVPETEMPCDGSIRLLSIGRYCTAKNFDNVPDICVRIRETGLNVKWYIIGFGGDEELIRKKIAEAGMEEHVILLGKKENPYPYIAACDLYVQPSRYEGNCVTVHEAQMLGKPVVITAYPTSPSQLEDGVDGVIVPVDNQGCAEGIALLLRESERMKQLAENCKTRDYSNSDQVEKIYQLIDNE